jgi:hypothetical protein
MALDPAVLKARIDLRVCQLKRLAAWTAVNWRGRARRREIKHSSRENASSARMSHALVQRFKSTNGVPPRPV